jgi:hypothetical protein
MSPEDIAGAEERAQYQDSRPPSLWWALHRPETYALAAIAIALVTPSSWR